MSSTLASRRGPGPVGQFQTLPVKTILRFLTIPYICAQRVLYLAREVQVFHMTSMHIARQALHLLILLNDSVDATEGPNEQQQDERIDLGDDLIELEKALKQWGTETERQNTYDTSILQLKQKYAQFFKKRFYFHNARDPEIDPVFQKLLAYDDRTTRPGHSPQLISHPNDAEVQTRPRTRSTRTRVPVDAPLRGRTRHGCWTCRIRRKKCDEQQAGEGRCGNCSRLQIDCVGWGERRPEWIKDPAQLQVFKDSMKAQIHRQTRKSGDLIPNMTSPTSSAPAHVPSSAHPSSSEEISYGEILGLFPHLTLPSSLIRPLTPGSVDPYNYRVFVEHVRILVNAANLPHICGLAFADAARLGEWKHDELDRGCLSYRELARRAVPIEKALINACETQRVSSLSSLTNNVRHSKPADKEDMLRFSMFAEDEEVRLLSPKGHASSDISIGLDTLFMTSEPPTQASDAKPEILSGIPASYTEAESSVPEPVSLVPYVAALLFLHSIVSGPDQKVPEISSMTERITRLLMAEEASEMLPKMQRLLAVALIRCLSNNELAIGLFNNVIITIEDNEPAYNSAIILAQRSKEVNYTD